MRPSTSRIGWRSCRFQSRSVSRWPLNAAMEKSGPLRKSEHRLWVAGIGARRRFADHARRRPGLHVQRGHAPRIQFHEPVLHLDRAPLVLRGVPTGRNQAGRAGDRPRIPGAVGQIGREHFALVGGDEHVIGRRLLREHRHLALDQGDAAIGTAGAAGIFENSLLNDLGAEARGGAAQCVGIELVLIMRADDQQPALPLLPHQILGERIRQHRARRRDMDDVGAAVLLAQPVVDRAGIQQQRPAIAERVGGLQQLVGRKVGDDEAVCARQALLPPSRRPHHP